MSIAIKIHKSYRNVVALCDSDLLGKKFLDGKRQLFLRENFYKEKEVSEEEALKIIIEESDNDATFNIVGKKSIKAALKVGIINKESVATIQNIPFILVLI